MHASLQLDAFLQKPSPRNDLCGAPRWEESAFCPALQGKLRWNQDSRWPCKYEPTAHILTIIPAQGSSLLLSPADKYSETWHSLLGRKKQFHDRVRGKQGWQMRRNLSKRRELLPPFSSSSPLSLLPPQGPQCLDFPPLCTALQRYAMVNLVF